MTDCDHGALRLSVCFIRYHCWRWFLHFKGSRLRIVADGLGMFIAMPDRLARWLDDLGSFSIDCQTNFDPVLAFVPFCRAQEVDGSCVDLEDLVFLHRRRTGEVIGFAGKRVHERQQEFDGRLLYHECQLPSMA